MTATTKISALKARVGSFAKQEDGAVAMVFALAAVPFCMAVALAVDYSRAVHMKQKFAAAIDAATVAAAKSVRDGMLSDDEIKAQAYTFFKQNIQGHYATYAPEKFDVQIDRKSSRVDIKLPASVPTTFARVGGFEKMAINQAATAVFQVRDIEVGLALDVTGSMNSEVGGRRKIDSLKSAFAKFANLMIPDTLPTGQKVRMGLAPYSASINLGSYASVASGGASTDNCVTERTSVAAMNSDMAPGGLHVFRVAADNRFDIDSTEGYAGVATPGARAAYYCPSPTITPMTADRSALIDAVNSYTPNGWTAGHIGAQWAWNLISPRWKDVWGTASAGEPYGNKKVVKAVILMTDGVFNTAYHNTNSSRSSDQAIKMCEEMKKAGVQVFSLIFGLNDATAANTMKTCSSGDEYYVNAASEAELDAAFEKFAGKINGLRLAQ